MGVSGQLTNFEENGKRVNAKNADFEGMQAGGGSAVSYAWWIWQKGYAGPTTLDWINHPKPSLNPNVTQLQLF